MVALLRRRPIDMIKDIGTGRNIEAVLDRVQEIKNRVLSFRPLERIGLRR